MSKKSTSVGVGKKVLASALSAAMVVAFTPAVALAADGGDDPVVHADQTATEPAFEVWNGFNVKDKVQSFVSLDEAFQYVTSDTYSSSTKRVVVSGNAVLDSNVTIPNDVYLDVLGTLTIPVGCTLTIQPNAKRLGIWAHGVTFLGA